MARALPWHGRGEGFESPQVHHELSEAEISRNVYVTIAKTAVFWYYFHVMANDYAVIKLNSKQLVVEKAAKFAIDKLPEKAEIAVLLAEIGGESFIGEPELSDIGVKLTVIEEKLDKKISVRRFRSKSRYRRNKGHRQPISIVEVAEIGKGVKSSISKGKEEKVEKAPKSEKKVEKKSPAGKSTSKTK